MTRAVATDRCGFCDRPAITNLDGDNLCQAHANQWVRAEGEWAAYVRRQERENAEQVQA